MQNPNNVNRPENFNFKLKIKKPNKRRIKRRENKEV